MSPLAVDLYGYGRVARALLPRLHHAGIRVATIHDRSGLRRSRAANGHRRVVVDATSPEYDDKGAEPWLERLEELLSGGTPVVTCNKAPLAIGWGCLLKAAKKGGTTVSCTATVGAGTPILPNLRWLQQAHGVASVEGSLNGTLEFVFDQIRRGSTLAEAVRGAQRVGLAEPDPALDLDGTDAYAKAVIIHNVLFPDRPSLTLGKERPRLRLRETRLRLLAKSGRAPRALAVVDPGKVRLAIRAPRAGGRYPAEAGQVFVRAFLRDGSTTFLAGRGGGPAYTAGGLIGDLLALSRANGDAPPGVFI